MYQRGAYVAGLCPRIDPPREKGDLEDFSDDDEEYIGLLVSFMSKLPFTFYYFIS
jgi:hypothetical protein